MAGEAHGKEKKKTAAEISQAHAKKLIVMFTIVAGMLIGLIRASDVY